MFTKFLIFANITIDDSRIMEANIEKIMQEKIK